MTCPELAELISKLQDKLKKTLRTCKDPFTNPDVKDSRDLIKELQTIYDKSCGGPEGGEPKVPEKFEKLLRVRNEPEWWENLGKAAYGAAGAYGAYGAYLLYRGLRLLPFLLFPPLWPTLAANVAAP